jgi:hypothetical protein
MAKKEPLKKAILLPGGGRRWAWTGQNDIKHTVDYDGKGITIWTVWHGETPIRQEEPWFLVRALGEVQENIKHYRNAGLDLGLANRAMLSVGLYPDQHVDAAWCTCFNCKAF